MNKPDSSIVDPESPTVVAAQDEPGSILVKLMEQCLTHLEAGKDVDREALIAAHPELQSQIDACLASLQFIHRAVQPTEGIPARLADFRIVREIGRGGMGVVYEAEQISLKRQVALKVLRFGAVADSEAMKRFQREAETIASLHHTNIVPVFAVGVEKSIHYYAMQLIEGRSLREVVQDSVAGPISNKTIAQWGLQAADALSHAHERGVVHRDIKPGNLILGLDGRIWLTDFGLAKRLDDVTLSLCGALLGTPRYMSPEQASALQHPVDHRTDIYSLGATLYELVTKRPLFDSDSPHVVISQILTLEPKPPRELVPGVPRDLETIILKCLCKDAGQRYQHARDLADDLRAFEEGRAIKARRATVVERTGRWLKQNGRLLAATVVTVAVTAALVIGGTEWWEMQNDARNGQLTLTTKEGPLSGEVLTASGEKVVPSFTIPNEQPAQVPEGEYQLRASGRGSLSKTGWLTVDRGSTREIPVDIDRPELYPSIALNSMTGYELIDFGAGTDLLVLPESPTISEPDQTTSRAKPNLLTRLSGATGKEIWALDISLKSAALKELLPTEELRLQWWSATVFGWKFANQPQLRVLRPLPDLDDDGVPDLVWRLHQGYSLFAVSGKTGRPMWWQAARFTDAAGNTIETMTSQTDLRRQFGDAVLASIPRPDGKATQAVIVVEAGVQSKEGSSVSSRIFALDARDKSPLWNIEVPGIAPRLAVAPVSGVPFSGSGVVVVATEAELLLFDLATGTPIGRSMKLHDGDHPGGNSY
ncbi:MAG TPA: serine/threonine-protein kinase, partial [Schlesneria sp.]